MAKGKKSQGQNSLSEGINRHQTPDNCFHQESELRRNIWMLLNLTIEKLSKSEVSEIEKGLANNGGYCLDVILQTEDFLINFGHKIDKDLKTNLELTAYTLDETFWGEHCIGTNEEKKGGFICELIELRNYFSYENN